MGKVAVNDVTISYAREASPGVLPGQPKWRTIEFNNAASWGNETSKTARSPISNDQQDRKGIITDLNQNPSIEADMTLSMYRDFAEAFLYSAAVGPDSYEPTAVASGGYTVPALTAAQAGRLLYSSAGAGATTLIYARGWANAANNGLEPLTAKPATAGVLIPVAGAVVESAPTANVAEVSIAGVRGAAGDIRVNSSGNLVSTALDFTTLGLTVGQTIWVGGLDVANQFFQTANTGFARVAGIAANLLTLDKRQQAFVTDDGTSTGSGGTGIRIDLLFGQFIRNVPRSSADYREITTQFEMAMPNLGSAGATLYEYAPMNYANQMAISIPLSGKATVTVGFIGAKMGTPTASRAVNADVAKNPIQQEAFGSASDIARLRLQDKDQNGLATDFKSCTITMTRNAQGDKVIGNLGPKYVNTGNFQVSIEAEVIVTDPEVIHSINCNLTLGIDTALYNGDGAVHFDFPAGTLGGGRRNFRANESVTLAGTFASHKDPVLGTSIGVSLFPVVPRTAC